MIKENEIVCGDCLDIIESIPDGTFDAVITDPPYKMETHGRGLSAKRKIYKQMSEWTNIDNDFYNDSFLDKLCKLCKFPNVFLFCGKRDVFRVMNYAEKSNLNYHLLPIIKKAPIPFTNNTWLSNEYAVHIVDRRLEYSNNYSDKIPYFICSGKKETEHPNEKKLEHLIRIVRNITPNNGFVFDCFCGSGTTPLACVKTNRRYYGIELKNDFVQMAKKRIEQEKSQLKLF